MKTLPYELCFLRGTLITEPSGLGLVHPQVPGATKVVQLLDGLRHLGFGVGQDEHVVGEG